MGVIGNSIQYDYSKNQPHIVQSITCHVENHPSNQKHCVDKCSHEYTTFVNSNRIGFW